MDFVVFEYTEDMFTEPFDDMVPMDDYQEPEYDEDIDEYSEVYASDTSDYSYDSEWEQ